MLLAEIGHNIFRSNGPARGLYGKVSRDRRIRASVLAMGLIVSKLQRAGACRLPYGVLKIYARVIAAAALAHYIQDERAQLVSPVRAADYAPLQAGALLVRDAMLQFYNAPADCPLPVPPLDANNCWGHLWD